MEVEKPKKKFGGTEKVLLGCALGCGILVLLMIAAGGFGTWWFFSPGEQVATGGIVGDESLGVVRTDELATDPGVQELITKVFSTFNEINRQQQAAVLPESMRWITGLQRSPRSGDLNQLIPKEATLVLENDAASDEPAVVAAVNFRTMIRPIKAMFAFIANTDETNPDFRRKHRGHDIYRFGDESEGSIAFVGSTLLFSSTVATLERAIDRLEGISPGVSGAGERLARELPEGDWDATGTFENQNGLVIDLIRSLVDDETLEAPGGLDENLDLTLAVDVVSADEISWHARLDCPDPRSAHAWLTSLEERFPALRERFADWGLQLDVDARIEGGRVVTEWRLTGLLAAIENTVRTTYEVEAPPSE